MQTESQIPLPFDTMASIRCGKNVMALFRAEDSSEYMSMAGAMRVPSLGDYEHVLTNVKLYAYDPEDWSATTIFTETDCQGRSLAVYS